MRPTLMRSARESVSDAGMPSALARTGVAAPFNEKTEETLGQISPLPAAPDRDADADDGSMADEPAENRFHAGLTGVPAGESPPHLLQEWPILIGTDGGEQFLPLRIGEFGPGPECHAVS